MLQKLPSIYKNVVNTHNNLETFYSKNQERFEESSSTLETSMKNRSVADAITEIFNNPRYSYMKKLRITVAGKTFETRFVREQQGKILTIDNVVLDVDKIDAIDILDER